MVLCWLFFHRLFKKTQYIFELLSPLPTSPSLTLFPSEQKKQETHPAEIRLCNTGFILCNLSLLMQCFQLKKVAFLFLASNCTASGSFESWAGCLSLLHSSLLLEVALGTADRNALCSPCVWSFFPAWTHCSMWTGSTELLM